MPNTVHRLRLKFTKASMSATFLWQLLNGTQLTARDAGVDVTDSDSSAGIA